MVEALVNHELLRWARERVALSTEDLARKIGVKPERLDAWEQGEQHPTFKQAEKLAAATYIPFAYLFLDDSPDESLPIPDLRTLGSETPQRLDANFLDLIRDIQFKQDWYRDHLLAEGAEPLTFIGKFQPSAAIGDVANDIRQTLTISPATRAASPSWEGYLRLLMDLAEAAGIWVIRNSIVANNTRRPLRVEQFRGFAISDPIAPLIFINGRDAKAAQIFTLAHEVAHLWFGASGVSNVPLTYRNSDFADSSANIERICNQVAAEVLVPGAEIQHLWNRRLDVAENAAGLSREFKVSQIVLAKRAFDLGLISWDRYKEFYDGESARWRLEREKESAGGDYYRIVPMRNGRKFTNAVLISAMRGELLLRNASALLNAKPATIKKMYEKQMAD
ncbi:MAG: ImmA/IrrE family metallo-endopeptidase [Gemmatimonas sp.]